MTDRELLEAAAKAAGLTVRLVLVNGDIDIGADHAAWNPLTNDGDALRLAVKLQMQIDILYGSVRVLVIGGSAVYEDGNPDAAATRRAIVRAAAAMAKQQT
jgi:hypothetical protein